MKYSCLFKRLCGLMLVAAALLLPLTAAESSSAGTTGYEDVMSGFDEKRSPVANDPAAADKEQGLTSRLDLSGEATLSSVWNVAHEAPDPGETDYRGLSRMRASLDLVLEAEITDIWRGQVSGRGFYDFAYHIEGHDDFTRDVLEEYEDELEFRETYIEGKPMTGLDIRAGRQLIVWGNSETFRVTDILNPLDNRDPGLVDVEDLRLPVCMIRTDYQWRHPSGYYDLTGVVIPELRFDKGPVYGNDFYPFDMSLPHERTPGQSFENGEYAMALKGVFPHWDFSLYGAYHYDNESYLEKTGVVSYPIQMPDGSVFWQSVDVYERWHSRLWMTGLSVNYAVGDWLLKTELAQSDGYQYANEDGRKSQTRGLAGVEYMGFTDTTLTLECLQTVLHGYDHDMGEAPDYADSSRFDTAFRFTQNRMNDRLELVFVALVMGMEAEDGLIERLSAAYDITDAVTVTGGCIFYQDGESVLTDNIHDNNRVFMDLTYAF